MIPQEHLHDTSKKVSFYVVINTDYYLNHNLILLICHNEFDFGNEEESTNNMVNFKET